VEDYLTMREINIGMYPTICMIDHALGHEMGAAQLADPDWAEAERLASRVVTIQNDLVGYVKDGEARWLNVVRAIADESGCGAADAFARTARHHAAHVAELAAALDRVVRRHGPAARPFAHALGCVVAGFGRWHVTAPRYASDIALPEGGGVDLAVAAA
jgi:hypothetical protein